jgi:hypothetical protein
MDIWLRMVLSVGLSTSQEIFDLTRPTSHHGRLDSGVIRGIEHASRGLRFDKTDLA